MVRAWYMDSSREDPHLPHMTDPPEFLDVDTLMKRTGCEYIQLNPNDVKGLQKIRRDRGYTYQDQFNIRRDDASFDEQSGPAFHEHLHSDEEIRFCMDGSAYFDARDVSDRWVRIEFSKGDLLILPPGIYHRFCLDQSNYIKLCRLFADEPRWTPINRPAEEHPARQTYLQTFSKKG